MNQTVSKSKFKAHALEYLRQVEQTGDDLLITDRGKAVVRVTKCVDSAEFARKVLRGSVLSYDRPTEPVGEEDWEALR